MMFRYRVRVCVLACRWACEPDCMYEHSYCQPLDVNQAETKEMGDVNQVETQEMTEMGDSQRGY